MINSVPFPVITIQNARIWSHVRDRSAFFSIEKKHFFLDFKKTHTGARYDFFLGNENWFYFIGSFEFQKQYYSVHIKRYRFVQKFQNLEFVSACSVRQVKPLFFTS